MLSLPLAPRWCLPAKLQSSVTRNALYVHLHLAVERFLSDYQAAISDQSAWSHALPTAGVAGLTTAVINLLAWVLSIRLFLASSLLSSSDPRDLPGSAACLAHHKDSSSNLLLDLASFAPAARSKPSAWAASPSPCTALCCFRLTIAVNTAGTPFFAVMTVRIPYKQSGLALSARRNLWMALAYPVDLHQSLRGKN